ncbi:hypothetical protein [Roseinatronobacter monicus]|uniref:hypothetical protein n=1 Tax=Roseinatronobacter monicus TaxID=393481 RepID=UPI0014770E14|nr:hypothetical protein [Roseinatronobacter monicus]
MAALVGAVVQPLTVGSFCSDSVLLLVLRRKDKIGGFLGFGGGFEDQTLVILQGAQLS